MICADPLVLFSGCSSQDKIVFVPLISSENENKTPRRYPLRALVTEQMPRAQSPLEFLYSSPFKLFTSCSSKFSEHKVHLLPGLWKGVEEESNTDKVQGVATQGVNVWGINTLHLNRYNSDGLPVSSAILGRVQEH